MSSSLSQQRQQQQQQQQDDGATVSNEAPAFLSRQQVAHLRTALALVVMRQRCRQKRKVVAVATATATATAEQQQDDETSNRQQQQQQRQQAAPHQVPMTKRTRLCPQENVSPIATTIPTTTIPTTTSTRQHVHYMMETAVTQVLRGATSNNSNNNNNDKNSRQPQGLLVHLAQTWQAWAVQDPTQAAALCQSLLLQQQQHSTRMAALCSVYKNILLLVASLRASQQPLVQVWQDSVQHVLRAALRQTTNDDDNYITTTRTTTTTTIGIESLSPHVSLDALLPLVSFYEFCLQQQSNATTSTSTNPSRQTHDHDTTNALPSMGLLPTDVYTHWISFGGGTTTTAALSRVVDALWMRHAVGTARQRAALVRYVANANEPLPDTLSY